SSKILRAGDHFKGKLKDGTPYDWTLENVPLDFDSPMMVGSMSGSGAVIVLDDTIDIVEALANLNAFYAHESCGQCTPCREGSLWMSRITRRIVAGEGRADDAALLASIGEQISGRTICAHGEACAWPTQSYVAKFPDEFAAFVERKGRKNPAAPRLV
ncbi:MAG TPA: NADH-ubiquinone oxidoreductase-F iron-sulfur binding region domain-containing protein, partial [Opitutales bacterium]|nr:NADH-ubiquinone oxidoreductase-F iron-sulfur binding region domain-containing protein [Opitutales bacterium]